MDFYCKPRHNGTRRSSSLCAFTTHPNEFYLVLADLRNSVSRGETIISINFFSLFFSFFHPSSASFSRESEFCKEGSSLCIFCLGISFRHVNVSRLIASKRLYRFTQFTYSVMICYISLEFRDVTQNLCLYRRRIV